MPPTKDVVNLSLMGSPSTPVAGPLQKMSCWRVTYGSAKIRNPLTKIQLSS
jgi:hypothetical protein